MRSRLPLTALLLAAACGGAGAPDRVSVMAVDRLSGELGAQEVELPGTDLTAVRGPAGIVLLDGTRTPDCQLRRKVSGSLVARTLPCVSLIARAQVASLIIGRQILWRSLLNPPKPWPLRAMRGNQDPFAREWIESAVWDFLQQRSVHAIHYPYRPAYRLLSGSPREED